MRSAGLRPEGQQLRLELSGSRRLLVGVNLSSIGSTTVVLDVLTSLIGHTLDGSGAHIALLLHSRLSLLGHARNVLLRGHADLVNSRYSSVLSLRDALVGLSPNE